MKFRSGESGSGNKSADPGDKSTDSGTGNYVGLILAAGYSSRMGAFKPLLPIGDMTAVQHISSAMKRSGISRIIGVTGFQRELLRPLFVSEGIREAYNPDFDRGMFSSVKAGLRAAVSDGAPAPGFFLWPVDCPLVPPEVLEQILIKHKEVPGAFIVPCFRGKKGHPLFIPAEFAGEILAYEGEGGLKAVTGRHEDRLIRLETGTEAVVLDMDTPEGYEEILAYYQAREKGIPEGAAFEEEMKGRRLFLVRHGEIRQHREKIFLGRTDVPLSDTGRLQAEYASEKLRQHSVFVNRIYTSDLSRAVETAAIIREGLSRSYEETEETKQKQKREAREVEGISGRRGIEVTPGPREIEVTPEPREIEVIPEPGLREMSLGEWDGSYISEIREKYPEEYLRRGNSLLTWKIGNDGENFYDLQYRVMKSFRNILERERNSDHSGRRAGRPKDLVIVSHMGVINVIMSNLLRKDLAEQIKNRIPNGGIVLIDETGLKEI